MSRSTNRRNVEKAELAAIREAAKEAIVTTTSEGIITSWNPAAERIFGYTADEMLGKSALTIVAPEDAAHESQIINDVKHGRRTDDYETRRIHKQGPIVDVCVTFSPHSR